MKLYRPQIGPLKIAFHFRSDFKEFSIGVMRDWQKAMDVLVTYEEHRDNAEIGSLEWEECNHYIRLQQLSVLNVLCLRDDFEYVYLEEIAEQDPNLWFVNDLYEQVHESLMDFTQWWDDIPPIESFWMGLTNYKVHEINKTSVARLSGADTLERKVFLLKDKLDGNSWQDVNLLFAHIVRPRRFVHDISIFKKSFIRSRELKGLSNKDKAIYCENKIKRYVDKLAKKLEKMPLSHAVGSLKAFYLKKKR